MLKQDWFDEHEMFDVLEPMDIPEEYLREDEHDRAATREFDLIAEYENTFKNTQHWRKPSWTDVYREQLSLIQEGFVKEGITTILLRIEKRKELVKEFLYTHEKHFEKSKESKKDDYSCYLCGIKQSLVENDHVPCWSPACEVCGLDMVLERNDYQSYCLRLEGFEWSLNSNQTIHPKIVHRLGEHQKAVLKAYRSIIKGVQVEKQMKTLDELSQSVIEGFTYREEKDLEMA